jgi:TatD DNase family protein
MLIDTHAHLDSFIRRGDFPGVLERAAEAGVSGVITIGTEPGDWALYRDAASRPGLWFTVGLHPCSVDEAWPAAVAALPAYLSGNPRPVALGEIGLDRFHLPKDPAEAERIFSRQQEAFSAQLEIGLHWGGPLVIHSRGAVIECIEAIDRAGIDWSKVVFHCFTDGPDLLRPILERGGRASFTGIVTYKKADEARHILRLQGIDRLMVETDAPYLAPEPHRGKPNEPSYVRCTAERCAEALGMPPEALFARTTANARSFFGLE